MYPHEKEKQKITAQADPQTWNLVGVYYIYITGKESLLWETNLVVHKHTLVHTRAPRGEGVAKRAAVFVYIYKTPL